MPFSSRQLCQRTYPVGRKVGRLVLAVQSNESHNACHGSPIIKRSPVRCHPLVQLRLLIVWTATLAVGTNLLLPIAFVNMVWPIASVAFHFADSLQYGRHSN